MIRPGCISVELPLLSSKIAGGESASHNIPPNDANGAVANCHLKPAGLSALEDKGCFDTGTVQVSFRAFISLPNVKVLSHLPEGEASTAG